MGRLSGRKAIITGANAGIGRGIAEAFAQEGADICICARRADLLEETAEFLRGFDAKVVPQKCDVTNHDDLGGLVAAAARGLGGIDILVNNAAYIGMHSNFEDLPFDDWEKSMKAGVEATFLLMQKCFPYLKENGGNIVNFSSSAATRGAPNPGYSATKAGIEGISKTAAIQWFKHGISVNCIAPSAWSEGWDRAIEAANLTKEDAANLFQPRIEGWYVGDPLRDVGPAAVYLAARESKYITGLVIYVDGGQNGLGI